MAPFKPPTSQGAGLCGLSTTKLAAAPHLFRSSRDNAVDKAVLNGDGMVYICVYVLCKSPLKF